MRSLLAAVLAVSVSLPALAEGDRFRGWSLQLIDGSGNVLPTFEQGGRTYVLGSKGRRYSLRITNGSSRRVEFVASVDGRDVLDGKPASSGKRGYVVPPWGQVVIDGFRLDDDRVATFRFASVSHSYAALMGDARDVGVVGVAVFPERRPIPVVRRAPPPRWYDGVFGGERQAGDGYLADGRTSAAPPPEAAPAPAEQAPASAAGPSLRSLSHAAEAKKAERPGLGTEFGEARDSRVTEVDFQRESATPAALLTVRYDDRAGLLAMGVDLGPSIDRREVELRETADPFRHDEYSQPPPGWGCR